MLALFFRRTASAFNHFVDFDAGVGANQGAGCTAYAGLRVLWIGEMVASVVDFFRLKGEHIAWAGHHAEVASFATFLLDGDGSVNLCHTVKMLIGCWY